MNSKQESRGINAAEDDVVSADLSRVLATYHAIQIALGGQDPDPMDASGELALPLRDLLELLPRHYRLARADSPPPDDRAITIPVDDLYAQLARGRVAIPIARLLFAAPPSSAAPAAFKDQTQIEIPLPVVVQAIDPQVLRQRTSGVPRDCKTDALPDLFTVESGRRIVRPTDRKVRSPREPEEPAEAAPTPFPIPADSRQTAPAPVHPDAEFALPSPIRTGFRMTGKAPKPLEVNIGATPHTPAPPSPAPPGGPALQSFPPAAAHFEADAALTDILQPDDHSLRLELPSEEVLALLPERYRIGQAPVAGSIAKTTLIVEDLFEQLAQGRVAVPLAQLALGMPPSLVAPTAFPDQQPITLPLSLVVAALDPAVMRSKVGGRPRAYDLGRLPDFFTLGTVPPSSPAAGQLPVAAPAPPATEEPLAEEVDPAERLAGVNLNAATLDQLTALDGVADAVARRILEYRGQHGPFKDIFDLSEVPRIGRKTFRAITGMPYSAKRRHRREKLASLLGLPPARAAHLPTIVRALATQPGFSACIISDQQGFLLAAHGADGAAEALSAVLPTLTRDIRGRMRECTPEPVDSISLHVGGRLFTIVPSGDVYLTAMHRANRMTMRQMRLVTRVAGELAWLAGKRGYVAADPAGSPAGPGPDGPPPA